MANLKKIFTAGRMSKDADERVIPEGEYRHAENINILNSDTSENSGTVKNVLSNKKLTNFSFTGTVYNITPKPLVYEAKNRIYWFCKDDVGCYLLEYNINNKIITPVLTDTRPKETRVLKLDENFLITGIDILKTEDENKELLLWTDNNMQPCCININRAKTWLPNQFEEEDILLVKKPPRYAPKTIPAYTNDKSNNLENKFLCFAYRYKYLDGEYSALSSFSYYSFYPKDFDLDFFTLVNKGMVNRYNAVNIEFNTGDKRVVEIQIAVKETGSNTIYIIETLNKQKNGIADNQKTSILFSNQKIYQALAENELYRAFDNVPLKAKAQTLINNFIAYGNYLEFYDIKNQYNENFVMDYDVSLDSTPINEENQLAVGITSNGTKLNFNTASGVEYKKDNIISVYLEINIESDRVYANEFFLQLPEDYRNLNEVVATSGFISLTQTINQDFVTNYNAENQYPINANYALQTETSIVFAIESGLPTFTVTPILYNDTANGNSPVTISPKFYKESEVRIDTIANTSSCKSNQGYQVGIIYLDKYNRATTVQTCKNNTIFIPQNKSSQKNRLVITLNNIPPIDADRYKFAIKTQPLQYQTIFINEFYNEGNFVWAKLQSDNKDKVRIGDSLIVKTYKKQVSIDPIKTKVLDIKEFGANFVAGNTDTSGNQIIESPGVYMKIRPEDFSMDFDDYQIYQSKKDAQENGTPVAYLDLFTKDDLTELKIPSGSSISIYLNSSSEYKKGGWVSITYKKDFIAQTDYDTLEEWFTAVFLSGSPIYGIKDDDGSLVNYYPNLGLVRDPTGKLHLKITGLIEGSSGFFRDRAAYVNSSILIRTSTGIYVFETENKQADNDIFFETEETFDIVNGEHHGSTQYPIIQNQNNATFKPAIIKLNFFNCFTQGNGVESYRVRDEFNTKHLNIDYRPSTTSIEPYKQVRRFADITHSSEPYNESSNVNGLNNFNLATANFKELDKQYGSIQLLHNKLNDILVIQEEKAGKILFGKQAIYTAEGEPLVTQISEILGQYTPYQGNNGIGLNPESFAQDNFRYYWFNPYFGTPIRLSIDGTTEINNGMQTYFRNIAINSPKALKLGAFDTFNKLYTLSLEDDFTQIDVFNCSNSFQKVITDNYSYILKLNNEIGDINLNYNVLYGSVTIKTTFNNNVQTNLATGTGTVTIDRNTLDSDELLIELIPTTPNSEIQITNLCPIPTPLTIVLVVLGDELDNGKTILNRFRANSNSFLQYEDTFIEDGFVTKFETLNGFEGQKLFPINGDTITIQSVKRQSHTGAFLQDEECNRLKYLVSDLPYNESTIGSLLDNSTNLTLTKSVQGINQNTFTGSFIFNRANLNQKLYLIWDYTNRKPLAVNDVVGVPKGQSVTFNPLANDVNSQSNTGITITQQPINGTAVVNIDKTITYTHNNNNELLDTIKYTIQGSVCSSQEATIEINIAFACDASFNYSGNQGVFEYPINFGTALGTCGIQYQAYAVADMFEIIYNGIVVATTGGPVSTSGTLGSPTAEWADLLFNKTTISPITATIRITANQSGTLWAIRGVCPF